MFSGHTKKVKNIMKCSNRKEGSFHGIEKINKSSHCKKRCFISEKICCSGCKKKAEKQEINLFRHLPLEGVFFFGGAKEIRKDWFN
jgi:hypothetical protein